ncbi:C4-dicarboxylate ABC transporter permease [Aureimonas fodinaquatilis]|uniref:C4-dicarboxylate ABC transporter permease n=1 Tax=Aureimonas fodinaquatilis TaxID=2565783 RepID=A0A5B0E3H3_9HYPH|nr:tripartite tricarboxylate transporter permease [Aureimonas fodinaquatilis]KAA0971949.1 C4-dicarboxylate ABC transporter permease [Aureimonas fodinaquatilis]
MILESLATVATLTNLIAMLSGVMLGIVGGALPGLTATMVIALLVPFTFTMAPLAALLMLCGIHAGANYGGAITAILLRTPGTPAAAATVLDGYPMAQKGQGRRAVELALYASGIGGLVSVLVMIFLSPLISNVALMFGPSEYFAIGIFGLTAIVGVAGRSLLKAIIAAALGLTLTLIGLDPVAGYPRFTFGSTDLLGGVPFLAALIGLFALPEAFRRAAKFATSKEETPQFDNSHTNIREVVQLTPEAAKSGLIGSAVGVLPGAGADVAAFIAYNEARRSAKDKSGFGKGDPRGLVAAESANNGITGGAMVPLLTLGVPGDAVTAVLIGAFTIQGIRPGPLLFETHLYSLIYPLFMGLIAINLLMLVCGYIFSGPISQIVRLPSSFIIGGVIVLSVVGAYSMQFSMFDVFIMLAFGAVGYFLEENDYPLSPIVLAIILGPMVETNLRRGLVMHSGDVLAFLSSPISLAIFALAAITVWFSVRSRRAIFA